MPFESSNASTVVIGPTDRPPSDNCSCLLFQLTTTTTTIPERNVQTSFSPWLSRGYGCLGTGYLPLEYRIPFQYAIAHVRNSIVPSTPTHLGRHGHLTNNEATSVITFFLTRPQLPLIAIGKLDHKRRSRSILCLITKVQ